MYFGIEEYTIEQREEVFQTFSEFVKKNKKRVRELSVVFVVKNIQIVYLLFKLGFDFDEIRFLIVELLLAALVCVSLYGFDSRYLIILHFLTYS